jgi:hypothetical protein
MKKILFVVTAFVAVCFASCGNRTANVESTDEVVTDSISVDSTVVVDSVAVDSLVVE